MKLFVEMNKMYRTGCPAKVRPIAALLEMHYNKLTPRVTEAIVFAGIKRAPASTGKQAGNTLAGRMAPAKR